MTNLPATCGAFTSVATGLSAGQKSRSILIVAQNPALTVTIAKWIHDDLVKGNVRAGKFLNVGQSDQTKVKNDM